MIHRRFFSALLLLVLAQVARAADAPTADAPLDPQVANAVRQSAEDTPSSQFPAQMTGVVMNTNGEPIPNVSLQLKAVTHFRSYTSDFGEKVFATRTAKSDATGQYVFATSDFPAAPPGRPFSIEVLATHSDRYAPLETWHFMSNSSDVISEEFAALTLPTGVVISGRVVDSDGEAVADATINAVSTWRGKGAWRIRNAPVAMDGTFRIVAPDKEKIIIHVASSSSGTASVEADATDGADTDQPLVIKLDRGKSLIGKVVSTDGKPIGGTLVVIQRFEELGIAKGANVTRVRFAAKTDAEGKFRLPPASGRFDCFLAMASVSDERRETKTQTASIFADQLPPPHVPFSIDLDGDLADREIVIRESETVTLKGRVTAADGTACANLSMVAYTTTETNGYHLSLATTQTDKEGRYRMRVPKNITVTIRSADFSARIRPKTKPREDFRGDYIRLEMLNEDRDGLDFIDLTAKAAEKQADE